MSVAYNPNNSSITATINGYGDAVNPSFSSIAIPNEAIIINKDELMKHLFPGRCRSSYTISSEKKKKLTTLASIANVRRIVRNGPATVVFWDDDTKTVVMRKKGEKDDPYYAFCAAVTKKIFESNSHIKKLMDTITVDETKKTKGKKK